MTNMENIYQECNYNLRQFIRKRIADESMVEDVLQEIFVKIHSQIDTLRDVRKLHNWIYQIARNTIIDHYRSKKAIVELPEELKSADDPDNYDDNDVFNELTPCIQSLIDMLPKKYSDAVVLTVYQGLTQKEMGQKLGISVSGSKSRIQRARQQLKNILTECCRFELDGSGKIMSYEDKPDSCIKC